MKLLLSPHNDDEALFASYLCLRERPKVIVCLNGARKKHYPAPHVRAAESAAAMEILGCQFEHLPIPIDPPEWDALTARLEAETPERVWVPLPEPGGHPHHNRVARIAIGLWPGRVRFYSTYRVVNRWPVRSTHGHRVAEQEGWAELKRAALACYPTQSGRQATAMHFDQPLDEYEASAIRLNLGGGINPVPGYVNLDKTTGWKFEDGLNEYPDGSVEAITVSHVLMYVPVERWPFAFAEMERVLAPGGMLRITEDAIGAPGSRRPVIRPHAQVATTADLVLAHLAQAGLAAAVVGADQTGFFDRSLIQQNYGQPPDVFHVEASKAAAAWRAAA